MSVRYRCLSGRRFDDAAALAYLDGNRSGVMLTRPGRAGGPPVDLALRLVGDALLTGLWRGPDGTVWVVDAEGRARWSADPFDADAEWGVQELDATLRGITGGPDGVFAWGTRPSDGAGLVRREQGRGWQALPTPGFVVQAMASGASGTWAVGEHGWVAGYRTDRWEVVGTVERALVSVAATGEGFLAGTDDGRVIRGDLAGHEVVGEVPGAAHAVAWWMGKVWVGAGSTGLWAGTGGFDVVRADRACRSLEAHEALLIGCDAVLCSTEDGARFPAVGRDAV